MSERKINLEQILISKLEENSTEEFDLQIISKLHFIACYYAMEEACKQVLELAAENAKVEEFYRGESYRIKDIFYDNDDSYIVANKQSILDTIKQVE